MAADIDQLPGGHHLGLRFSHGQKTVLLRGKAHRQPFQLHPVNVVSAQGKLILNRQGIAEVHNGIDVRQRIPLLHPLRQRLDRAHKLVRVHVQAAKRLTVRLDIRYLPHILSDETLRELPHAPVQHGSDDWLRAPVVDTFRDDDAEAVIRNSVKNLFFHGKCFHTLSS